MARRGVAMFAALLCAVFMQASGLSFDEADTKKRPTTKVVELLQGMQEQLEAEAKEDEKTYENFKCWCTKNTEEKGKSVKDAQRALKEKKLRKAELVSKSQRLKGEVESAEDEKAEKEAQLQKQKALRAQERKEYLADKGRLTGDLTSVDAAEAQFGNATGFLQRSQVGKASSLVQQLLKKHSKMLNSHDRETLEAFVQEDPSGGSSQVIGILQGMHDDFANDLAQLESDEAKRSSAFEQLAAALNEEIEATRTQIETKKQEKADATEESAHLKHAIKDLAASIGDDATFSEDIKKRCADMDAQWDERSATRAEESEAISKAIETLNSEDADEAFSKSIPSFLQQSASDARRESAANVLSMASQHDVRLAKLATKTKIDQFTKVKKAMNDMVVALKKEQQDDVDQKAYCMKAFRENQVATSDKTSEKEQLVAKEGTLKVKVDQASDDMDKLSTEIKGLKEQLAVASQDREAENKEFQRIIPEQKETQRLLKQALKVLANFYNKKSALVQVSVHVQQPKAPQGFKDYKANGQSFGVMSMIQQLIADSDKQVAEVTTAEGSAQKAYESFAKETASSVAAKEAAVEDMKAAKAKSEKAFVQTRQSTEGTVKDLEALETTKSELHANCDFIMANFDARQEARSEEIDSVEKAKAILSGATFAEIQLN
eukprot:TRINITY_DN2658_c0_g1_i1.p1 TRINITY_DN2658_c0_g1~~TRINITY_DN2658_c0_g1_i1.p1  ORF type:complete len:679 (-),score=227.07 TRINITY_DN2658_c0_g1_i1:43-2031(-)